MKVSYGGGSSPDCETVCKYGTKQNALVSHVLTSGDRPCTIVNEISGLNLVRSLFPQVIEFTGDMVLKHVQPGLYSKKK